MSNIEMGYIFEELIRRFNEASNNGLAQIAAAAGAGQIDGDAQHFKPDRLEQHGPGYGPFQIARE